MLWFYLALISVLFFTALNLLSRVVSVDSHNPRALAVAFNMVAITLTSVIFFATGQHKHFSINASFSAFVYLFVAVLLYGILERIRFYAAKYVEVSTLTTIGTLSVVIAFLGSILLYDEKLTLMKLAGMVFVVVSIVVVSLERNKNVTRKGIYYAVVSSILLGGAWALDKMGATNFNAETYTIMVWVGPFFFLFFFPTVKLTEVYREFKLNTFRIITLAVANVAGYYFQIKALSFGNATQVIPIVQTSVLTTVLAGIIVLGEKKHVGKKLLAALTGFIGVYLLL